MTESLQDEKQGVTETTHIQNALPVMSEGNELVDNAAKEQIQNMDVEDRAMALERALQADPGIPEWSWRMVKFNLICILACVLGSDGGFDRGVLSSVNSMTTYTKFFHIDTRDTSLAFGFDTLGTFCSCVLSAYFPNKIGRRWCICAGSLIIIGGALMSGLSPAHLGCFIAGRFLTGVGAGFAGTAGKAYLAEITPPHVRGKWLGTQGAFSHIGQIVATGVAIPLGRRTDEWSWRVPIMLQGLPAVFTLFLIMFVPESPRWLYSKGRVEQARTTLANLHSRDRDPNSPLICLEVAEIEESIVIRHFNNRWWDPLPLINSRSNLWRFGLSMVVAVFQTVAGNGLLTYFLPSLLKDAGITSPDKQRILNTSNQVIALFGSLLGILVVDHFGRRKLMLFGQASMAVFLAITAGLMSDVSPKRRSQSSGGIASLFLFNVCYSASWTTLASVYPTECFSYQNRAKGLSWWTLIQSGIACVNTFGLPPAIKEMEWKVYILFAGIDVIGFIVVWMVVVETKNLSLEDLDGVFEARNPKRASIELQKTLKNQGHA